MLTYAKRKWIINQLAKGASVTYLSRVQSVSRQAIYDLKKAYQMHGERGLREKSVGRPRDEISPGIKQLILDLQKEGHGVHRIEGLLKLKGIPVSHNKIHRLLTRMGRIIPEPKKGKKRNYIRWERRHSNSLWQTDFCWVGGLGCWLCAWLDDHSRFVTIAQYLTEATTDNVIALFEKAAQRYGYPQQTLSDRGTQFWPNRGGTSRFIVHLESKGVEHIYASV
ncbi:MAG: DDE-type integrase/transposase/recombinase, partial [Phycisphaerales bacterium]|nr:DDE-type integrase/transposase/recombinase [Phycisphaerales bacterium]